MFSPVADSAELADREAVQPDAAAEPHLAAGELGGQVLEPDAVVRRTPRGR